MTIELNQSAPHFELLSDSHKLSLKDLKGKKVILYFYPKDDTPGCTREACDFRDALPQLNKLNATVVGISKDDIKSHQKFKQKYALPFPLLADEDGKVCETYSVWVEKSMYGKKYMGIERSTFLLDEQGKIQGIWRKVKVDGHVDEVKEKLKELG